MKTVSAPSGRYYIVDEAAGISYPSVTTVISACLGKEGLLEWRASVGEEAADAIAKRAADRGTFMHAMLEYAFDARYAGGRTDDMVVRDALRHARSACPDVAEEAVLAGVKLFMNFEASDLYGSVGSVVAQETPVWSSMGGGFAGRLDLLAMGRDGGLVLVDFKSSTRPKRKEWVTGYELQASAYCAAYKDRHGVFPDSASIWISSESGDVQEFRLNKGELVERFRQFHGMVMDFHSKHNGI